MIKLSISSHPFSNYRISPLLLSFLSNNLIFWEYMHNYGMNFSDNRHILFDELAGNLLQGMLILLSVNPIKLSQHMLTFVQRLFQYLEEDKQSPRNMKPITKLLTHERKKISNKSFFSISPSSHDAVEKFKKDIFKEPYGTIVIMDAIETWLLRARKNWHLGIAPREHEKILMPYMVELMIVLTPHLNIKTILQAFERLLSLQVLGMFDDYSSHKLLNPLDTSALERLSHFSLVYVGAEFEQPINHLLEHFIRTISLGCASISKTSLAAIIQEYFNESLAKSRTAKPQHKIDSLDTQQMIAKSQKLTLARMAYLLFSIEVQRGMSLDLTDYRVMLHFYHTYLESELMRFPNDEPLYMHQLKVCSNILNAIEASLEVLPVSCDLKAELLQSKEYEALKNLPHDPKLLSPHAMST